MGDHRGPNREVWRGDPGLLTVPSGWKDDIPDLKQGKAQGLNRTAQILLLHRWLFPILEYSHLSVIPAAGHYHLLRPPYCQRKGKSSSLLCLGGKSCFSHSQATCPHLPAGLWPV